MHELSCSSFSISPLPDVTLRGSSSLSRCCWHYRRRCAGTRAWTVQRLAVEMVSLSLCDIKSPFVSSSPSFSFTLQLRPCSSLQRSLPLERASHFRRASCASGRRDTRNRRLKLVVDPCSNQRKDLSVWVYIDDGGSEGKRCMIRNTIEWGLPYCELTDPTVFPCLRNDSRNISATHLFCAVMRTWRFATVFVHVFLPFLWEMVCEYRLVTLAHVSTETAYLRTAT